MAENYITYQDEKGNVNISEEVIAVIVAAAVAEVEGIAGLSSSVGGELADFLGKKSIQKGIKVQFDEGNIVVDAIVMINFGFAVRTVAEKVQEAVISAVDSMTGLKCTVNVHVNGIAFDK